MKIYKITNTLNGKMYIGQTNSKLPRRFSGHVTAAKGGSTSLIHHAIRKYGKDAFKTELLEECDSIEESDIAEKKWIAELNTIKPNGYNIEMGGCRNRGSLSEETKAKLREAAKHRPPGWYEKICHAARNRGESWREKLREASTGRKPTAKQLAALEAGRQPGIWRPSKKGENNDNAILTWDKVSEIREMYATGNYSQEQLGRQFGVHQITISVIVRYKIWKINTPAG